MTSTIAFNDADLLTEREAAKYVRVISRRTLQQYRYRKQGPAYLIAANGRIRYLKSDLDAYMGTHRIDPQATTHQ